MCVLAVRRNISSTTTRTFHSRLQRAMAERHSSTLHPECTKHTVIMTIIVSQWRIYLYTVHQTAHTARLTFVNPISWSKMLAAVSLRTDGQRMCVFCVSSSIRQTSYHPQTTRFPISHHSNHPTHIYIYIYEHSVVTWPVSIQNGSILIIIILPWLDGSMYWCGFN